MTSNFPGTVDTQHGSETDQHAEMSAEDERGLPEQGSQRSLQAKLSPAT